MVCHFFVLFYKKLEELKMVEYFVTKGKLVVRNGVRV